MKATTSPTATGALLALLLMSGTSVFADSQATENPKAEAQAFLASPTDLSQAIATAEAAAIGKVSGIEYQSGKNGMPDLILADVVLTDGTEKTVAINPVDGKVMTIALTTEDQQDEEPVDDEGAQNRENADN